MAPPVARYISLFTILIATATRFWNIRRLEGYQNIDDDIGRGNETDVANPSRIFVENTEPTDWTVEETKLDVIFSEETVSHIPEKPNVADAKRVEAYIVQDVEDKVSTPLENCAITTQVRIITTSDGVWMMQSIDSQGKNKTIGGDEYYVTYKDDELEGATSTLVAFAKDQQDGTYVLDFVTSVMNPRPHLSGTGTLKVYFQYSCGIGAMAQPSKDTWETGGATLVSYSQTNITTPPFRYFEPPNEVDFGRYDKVVSFGDSLQENFVRDVRHKESYFRDNVEFKTNINSTFCTAQLPHILLHLEQFHGKSLRKKNANIALVAGSSVWDVLRSTSIQGPTFEDHLEACRQFVNTVRETYPNVSLFWKSPSAVHIQRVGRNCKKWYCRDAVRYMSNSRSGYLYEQQKKLMRDLGVTFLDLYEAYYLGGDYTMKNDGRHFKSDFARTMLSWYYPNITEDQPNS